MKVASYSGVSIVVALACFASSASADFPPNCKEALVLPVESIPVQARGEEMWDRASFVAMRAECQRLAADARRTLGSEFSVSTGGMSDLAVLQRLDEEVARRERARAAAAAQREKDNARQRAESERASKALAEQQRKAGADLLRQQDKTLRAAGVDPGTLGLGGAVAGAGSDDDDEHDATEVALYQRMVDGGAAPGCKGRKGAALIACVDAALDMEDDE